MSRQDRGVTDDAVGLADTIEHLARRGQAAAADEAVEIAGYIEVLASLLESELNNLFTSRR